MSMQTVLGAVAVLGLGIATVGLYAKNRSLEDRLDELRQLTGAVEQGADGEAVPGLGASDAKREIEALRTDVTQLTDRLKDTDARIAAAAKQPADGVVAGDAQSPAFDEAVRDIVLDMAGDVRFRTKLGLRGSPNLPKKPGFSQLAEALKLDATQEDEFRKDLQALKEDFLAIISEERDDGIVPLERIAEAEEYAEGDPRRAKVFIELFTLKVPGTEQTYLQRLVEMTTAFRKKTADYLRPEQTELFNAVDVDLLGVEMDG